MTVLPRNGGCFLLLFRGLHWRREGAPVPPVARGLVVLASGHDDHRERQIRTSGASTSVAPICQSGCQPLMNYGKPIIAPTRVAANPVLPTGTCPASQNAHDRADRKGDAPGCGGHQKNRGSATQCNRPQTAAMCRDLHRRTRASCLDSFGAGLRCGKTGGRNPQGAQGIEDDGDVDDLL